MIKCYHGKYGNLLRAKSRKGSNKLDFNVAKFRGVKRLFDIVACKCVNFNNCTCIKGKKGATYGIGVFK